MSNFLSPIRIALLVVGTALAIATPRADDDDHPAAKKAEAPKHEAKAEGLTLDAAAQARIGAHPSERVGQLSDVAGWNKD